MIDPMATLFVAFSVARVAPTEPKVLQQANGSVILDFGADHDTTFEVMPYRHGGVEVWVRDCVWSELVRENGYARVLYDQVEHFFYDTVSSETIDEIVADVVDFLAE